MHWDIHVNFLKHESGRRENVHFRHFDIKLRVVPKSVIIPSHFKIQYLGDCFEY